MAALEKYRAVIQKLLTELGQIGSSDTEVETQTVFDAEHDHYQLVQVGWEHGRRVYGCILHLDIKGGKIWIQHNGTELNIADELVALGVVKQDIVLGFHAPAKRKYTEFALG